MKGLLQTKTIELADAHHAFWEAYIIRPGAILMGGDTYVNKMSQYIFGTSWVIRSEELGEFVADLAVKGSQRNVIENLEMVLTGRRLLQEAA
jgi:hypothetical protein